MWAISTRKSKYRYRITDKKHPYELKACLNCNKTDWMQTRLTFCSNRCSQTGEYNSIWGGDKIKYVGQHRRVYAARGYASDFRCEDCGNQARDWANIHNTDRLCVENYKPLCMGCHVKYDRRGQ